MKKVYIMVIVVLAGLLAFAGNKMINSLKVPPATPEVKSDIIPFDEQTATRVVAAYARLDSIKQFAVGGRMVGNDPSEPANTMNVDFEFERDGNQYYYRVGSNEMLQLGKMAVDINKDIKKMFLHTGGNRIRMFPFSADSLVKFWKSEGYQVKADSTDYLVTVSLTNETHAYCKEYRTIFDNRTGRIDRMYMRLTDLSDPHNRKKDRELSMTFVTWEEGKVNQERFRESTYISRQHGEAVPAGSYASFSLYK